ncbi:MAG: NAD-dependent epimerase/dehydratase family protein [Candidatus Thorarchaeota archaeon]
MNILITGGTGFIGSRLALSYLKKGDKVSVLGQENTEAEKENSTLIKDNGAEVILASVLDKDIINQITINKDYIFHFAAAQHEMNIPDQKFWDVNVEGTKNIISSAISNGVKRFIHGSTIGVYGSLQGEINEESPTNPNNIYEQTKLEAEKLVLSNVDKIPTVVIRIPETFGPGDRRLLKLFKGIKKNAFVMVGKGKNLHHLMYIDDLIEGMYLASENNEAVGQIFLFAGQKAITTNEMISIIARNFNNNFPKIRLPLTPMMLTAVFLEKTLRPLGIQPPLHRRRMDFFVKGYQLSTKKSNKILGFSPKFDFDTGVKETKKWYEQNGLL